MVSQPPAASCSTVLPSASTASFTVCALPSAMTGEGNAAGLRTTCACRRASARAHAGASGRHAECMPACTACGRQGHGQHNFPALQRTAQLIMGAARLAARL